jgi:hypothetical protein
MKFNGYRLVLGVALTCTMPVASGHHSSARYDFARIVTISGTVTKYDWANPHVYVYVEQVTDAGEMIEWAVEAYPVAAMRRIGWSDDTLRPGDVITIRGNPTRSATSKRGIYPATIEAHGRTLFESAAVLPRLSIVSSEPAAGATSLDGTWETLAKVDLYLFFYNVGMELTDAGAAARDSYDEPTMSPALDCIPYSAPLLMIDPDFKQIVVDEDVITIRGGFAPAERTIHMNAATHDGATRTVQGHSIGRWEGETLVIDTTHFSDHRIGNSYRGIASGARKHLIERLTLLEGDTRLAYEFELTDSEFLAEPVTGGVEWAYRPDLEFVRDPCELDNARQFTNE